MLVVGGSRGLTGAPSLTAMAALRADAGYVTLAVPESTLPVFERRILEAVKRPLPEKDGLVTAEAADTVLELAAKANAVALGPGLGRGPGPQALVRRLLAELELPVVVDADALFELRQGDWPTRRANAHPRHEGELGRLLGRPSQEIAAHRLASVREAAERFRCVVLLKGADSLVAAPGAGALVCCARASAPSLYNRGATSLRRHRRLHSFAEEMEPQPRRRPLQQPGHSVRRWKRRSAPGSSRAISSTLPRTA